MISEYRDHVPAQTHAMHAQQLLVEEYADLVRRIALMLMARMPAAVQLDDLIQSGMIGLLEASAKYDPSKGASFSTYAGIRIRGAMLDELRRGDWMPRSVHRNARSVSDAIRRVEARLGRNASDAEVAAEMGLDLGSYHDMVQDSMGGRLFSLDQLLDPDAAMEHGDDLQQGSVQDSLQRSALRDGLAAAIRSLPEREQLVLALYYDEEMNLKEIGEVLGVSESRVCQIHGQAAMRLRSRMEGWR